LNGPKKGGADKAASLQEKPQIYGFYLLKTFVTSEIEGFNLSRILSVSSPSPGQALSQSEGWLFNLNWFSQIRNLKGRLRRLQTA
jgi:hypothetical protein